MSAWAWLATIGWIAAFLTATVPLGSIALVAAERLVACALTGVRRPPDAEPAWSLVVLVGFGMEGLTAVALGLAHVFYKWLLIALWAAVVVAGRTTIRDWARSAWSRRSAVERLLSSPLRLVGAFVAGSLALSAYVAAVGPPTQPDELAYHIPQAEIIARTHHLPLDVGGHYFYGNIPKLGETLYATTIALGGGLSIERVLQVTVFLAFVFCVAAALRALVGPGTGLLAACLLLFLDDLAQYAPTAYVDTFSACYEVAALLTVAIWLERRAISDLAAAALLLGTALSVKYTALPSALYIAAVVAAVLVRWRRPLRQRLLLAGSLLGIPLLVAGWWYVKNAVRYGNPFYPLYFGHRGVSDAEYQALLDDIQQFGPRTLHNFIRIPVRFNTLGDLPLFVGWYVFPLAAFVAKARRGLLFLVAFVVLYTPYWFFLGTWQTRFLANAESLVVILFAVIVTRLEAVPLRAAAAAACVIAIAIGTPSNLFAGDQWHHMAGRKVQSSSWDYAFGRESRTAYLDKFFGCEYGAVDYAQTHLSGIVMDNWTQWHDTVLDLYEDRVPFVGITPEQGVPVAVQLRRADMQYIYFRESTKQRFGEETKAAPDTIEGQYYLARLPVEEQALKHSTLVWREGDCRIYRVNPA